MKSLLDKKNIQTAFKELDLLLDEPLTLIVGGGGALVSAYNFPLATEDVDAFSKERNLPKLGSQIEKVAKKLNLPHDWLNPYFSTFTAVLPSEYSSRLKEIFKGMHLAAFALGPEDLLIMKCFAGRDKDVPHAKALIKVKGIDLGIVEDRLTELLEKKYPGTEKARDFFDDITEAL